MLIVDGFRGCVGGNIYSSIPSNFVDNCLSLSVTLLFKNDAVVSEAVRVAQRKRGIRPPAVMELSLLAPPITEFKGGPESRAEKQQE
jgi:hypothetical protein